MDCMVTSLETSVHLLRSQPYKLGGIEGSIILVTKCLIYAALQSTREEDIKLLRVFLVSKCTPDSKLVTVPFYNPSIPLLI